VPQLIDSHCHFDVSEFDADRDAALARARAAGVIGQIVPAIDAAGWPKLRELCARESDLHAAYGLHPVFLDAHRPTHLDDLATWLDQEKPVAVGECGLDFYIEGLDGETQRRYFRRQLELAKEFDLPVILHARRAVEEVIATLRQIGGLRGVVHSYSGSLEQARQLWKLGFFLGFGGPITYDRARRLREIVSTMPAEFLLLETDSPDQPLATHRGQRNEPALLGEVLQVAAKLRGEDPDALAMVTTANARHLFAVA
jgi:TatD DNase family protein